jgi:hypothetical protein
MFMGVGGLPADSRKLLAVVQQNVGVAGIIADLWFACPWRTPIHAAIGV